MFHVATPARTTQSKEAHDLVPQGYGGASRASALDIGLGLDKHFAGSTDEVLYGRVKCHPQAFQDDIARLAETINSTNYGNVKISNMLELKGLECHPTKTTFTTIGTKKYRKDIEEKLKTTPIIFGSFQCKPKDEDLGDICPRAGGQCGGNYCPQARQD